MSASNIYVSATSQDTPASAWHHYHGSKTDVRADNTVTGTVITCRTKMHAVMIESTLAFFSFLVLFQLISFAFLFFLMYFL
jgi:hypothetical protein